MARPARAALHDGAEAKDRVLLQVHEAALKVPGASFVSAFMQLPHLLINEVAN